MTASRSKGLLAIAVALSHLGCSDGALAPGLLRRRSRTWAAPTALSHLGCSDGRTLSQGTTVAVPPPAAEVQYAGTVGFQAAVTGAIDTGVVWSVRAVGGGSVSTGGLYTAPSAAGTFHVVAVSRAEPTAQGAASVTVVPLSTFNPNLTLDATTTSQTIDGDQHQRPGEFVRLLEDKGVEVHAPTDDELKGWCQATASVYDETRNYLGGSRVDEILQFRRPGTRAGTRARSGGRGAVRAGRRAARGGVAELPVTRAPGGQPGRGPGAPR
jgi:hypothetical protein